MLQINLHQLGIETSKLHQNNYLIPTYSHDVL